MVLYIFLFLLPHKTFFQYSISFVICSLMMVTGNLYSWLFVLSDDCSDLNTKLGLSRNFLLLDSSYTKLPYSFYSKKSQTCSQFTILFILPPALISNKQDRGNNREEKKAQAFLHIVNLTFFSASYSAHAAFLSSSVSSSSSLWSRSESCSWYPTIYSLWIWSNSARIVSCSNEETIKWEVTQELYSVYPLCLPNLLLQPHFTKSSSDHRETEFQNHLKVQFSSEGG